MLRDPMNMKETRRSYLYVCVGDHIYMGVGDPVLKRVDETLSTRACRKPYM
jgi:hypothetical protein